MGETTLEFERRFAEHLGGQVFSCAVSSCTAALHLALLAGGISAGDEVILPGLTFVADLNVIWMCGAIPVVADSTSLHNWNVSVDDIRRKISVRTRAVIVVHFAGYPCEMEAVRKLCRRHGLLLIEDAAHAVGAEYQGRKCGTWGDIGCFSFFSNKNLAVGEGGMLVSGDRRIARRVSLMRSHGMTRTTAERHRGAVIGYDIAEPGLNYRMDEMRAALGLVQLSKLDRINSRRRLLVREYIKRLRAVPGLIIPWTRAPQGSKPSYHIFPILLPEDIDRRSFMQFMRGRGVQTSIHYPSFKQFTFYGKKLDQPLPNADRISRRAVTLPLYPGMSSDDVAYVVDSINTYWNN